MKHMLERQLIYTDRDHKEEFDIPEAEWDELYELFITTKGDILDSRYRAVDFFNEVFYYLTCIYANNDSAEHIDDYLTADSSFYPALYTHKKPQTKQEIREAKEYTEMSVATNYYIMGFVWLILKKLKQTPKHVRFFQIALEAALENDANFDFVTFSVYYKKHQEAYEVSFFPKPIFTLDIISRESEEWEIATADFDRDEIKDIVHRFAKIDDKENLVHEMIQALEDSNNNRNYSHEISIMTYGRRADETFLNSLLIEEVAKAETLEEVNDTTERDGFEAYIIKNHKQVLGILLLVANMGKNQMPLLIKFIKAFRQLEYIKPDCFDNYDLFRKNAHEQFPNVNFDKANVKKNIEDDSKEHKDWVQRIADYLTPLLQS